jgi:lipopolysaccharide/colanic/teichoic acid biosynthesis glycosyltransferase
MASDKVFQKQAHPLERLPGEDVLSSTGPFKDAVVDDEQSIVIEFRSYNEQKNGFVSQAEADQSRTITQRSGSRSYDLLAKRVFDLVVSAFLLLLLSPGLLVIALAIKLTSTGPVLFRQTRYGLHGQLFGIYKFRTMYVDRADPSGVTQTRRADPRITPLGRFLRRSNLDEVPQLLNVVKGDMSLVGPRPHVPGMLAGGMLYEVLVPQYFERHRIRPGITGLAQVNGYRGNTEDPKLAIARIGQDLEYIENWSFGLDCRILIATVWAELIAGGNGT